MVALAGGTTPRGVYARLADDRALRSQIAWEQVRFFWGDERHVPPDHPDSNFRMAHDAMLGRLPVDPSHMWRIKGEYHDASQAAEEYEHDLQRVFGLGRPGAAVRSDGPPELADQLPRFDLVLLGMGAEGHTASLFPGTAALHEPHRLVVANWVDKLDTARITLTPRVLNNAAEVLFLVHGADKAEALSAVLDGPYEPDRLPAQLIHPRDGRVRWLVDPTAARLLSNVPAADRANTHGPGDRP